MFQGFAPLTGKQTTAVSHLDPFLWLNGATVRVLTQRYTNNLLGSTDIVKLFIHNHNNVFKEEILNEFCYFFLKNICIFVFIKIQFNQIQ